MYRSLCVAAVIASLAACGDNLEQAPPDAEIPEVDAEPPADAEPGEICDNDFEDDGDGYIDCDDSDCALTEACAPEALCQDGEDDDDDGATDCDDDDCALAPNCSPEGSCSNGSDDDLDGQTDCADDDCELFCLAGCVDGESLITVPAIGLPQVVDTSDVVVSFPVNADGWLAGAAVRFSIQHTFPSDLDISLESPDDGPVIVLSSDNPASNTGEDYVDTLVGAGATVSITTGGTPFTGNFKPEESFDLVTGLPARGDWRVVVHDDFAGETGTVQSMELYACVCNGTAGCETLLACLDGGDNDGDAMVDCGDPDCGTVAQCTAETACDDDVDNNLDGLTDCADPDCVGIAGCEQPESTCNDDFDNDADDAIDCADSSCVATAHCLAEPDCFDGTDDDGDGLTDCNDVGCNDVEGCELGTETSCADTIDNDGDGQADCADADCAGLLACTGLTCPAGSVATNRRATGLPITIPNLTTITSTVPLDHDGLVKEVIVRLDATHTNDTDLDIHLIAPGGTVELATDVGSTGDNFTGTVFRDGAATAITAGTAPFTGTFRPEGSLASLIGRPVTGNWTLQVADDLSGSNTGALTGYEVLVCQCTAASGDCEFGVACRNGTDDDGDGLVDCAETSCASDPFCIPETDCDDNLDSDLDTLIDCRDPSCDGIDGCEVGAERTCTDAFDNDDDAGVDCDDTDCAATAHCLPEADCRDGTDDDGDGLADCLDVGCDALMGCELGVERTCNDGVDNDGDASTDCGDSDCATALYCNVSCGAGLDSTYVVATDLPQPINSSTTINSVIPIATAGRVQEVAVKMNATHTYDGDLDVFLDAPGGSVELTSDNGGTGENYTNTIFTDDAATRIVDGVVPFTGAFRPEQPLAGLFATSLAGDWKLRVTDDAGGDTGTLLGYEVLVCHCDPTAGNCEFGVACRNGVDDDADALDDCDDPNCAIDPSCLPEAVCDDDLDDDFDGFADCLDADCDGVAGCELGVEVSCTDHVDNDGDGFTDCFDADCTAEPLCQVELVCNDAIDDDGNGQIDCSDPACATDLWCLAEADCTDGTDDDGDGAVDCADVGCNGVSGCVLQPESSCDDGVDNDGDHVKDCGDPDCTLWCAVTSCPAGTHKVWYRASGVPRAIPDNQPSPSVFVPITTSAPGVIADLALRVDVTHGFDGDVDLFLDTPIGRYEVSTDNGSTGDNYVRTVFTESGTGRIGSTGFTTAPFTGSFQPEQSFASLVGVPTAGTWSLAVADDASGDAGTLDRYELLTCQCDFASGNCELGAFACRNGVDDDNNGTIDCADPGCATDPTCAAPLPASEAVCNDGVDDDGDGSTDCADPDCGWVCTALGSSCTGGRQLLRVGAVDLPKTVPATPPSVNTSPFRVTRTGTIVRAAVRFNATHLNDADLSLFLTSPAGTVTELTSGNGSTGDNYVDTVFADTASGTIGTTGFNTAPFTGSYRPETALSLLSFESPTGVWLAQLRDGVNNNGGTWTELSLGLCVIP